MRIRIRLLALVLAGSGLSSPQEEIDAQAICTAPHSSPTLAGTGILGTLPPGGGWLQASLFGQRATQIFSPDGNRHDFLADSRFDTRSLYLTGAYGLVKGLEIWAQVPFHRLRVESDGGDSESDGVGDVRVAGRIGSELVGLDLPLTIRLAAKFPGSEFPVDATILPLTEGQRDFEVALESGLSLQPRTLYVRGFAGYRWREENTDAHRDPGDEAFASLAVGGASGSFHWELAADGLWGRPPVAQGLTLEGEGRRLLQLLPIAGFQAGPGQVEATAQIPLWGKNLPVGIGFSLGYRLASLRPM
jgi:hypothetical protein